MAAASKSPKLRVPLAELEPGEVTLPAEAARYLVRVRRLVPGDRVIAFDPSSAREAEAELLAAPSGPGASRAARLRVGELRPASLRPTRELGLIQAVGKGRKLDAVVRDATELGATSIVPAIAERSVKRPADQAVQLERLRRVALEAARQSGRGDVPELRRAEPMLEALERHAPHGKDRLGLCLHPAAAQGLGSALRGLEPTTAVTVVVGPEGGLSTAELAKAASSGYRLVSLGSLVLRTETACAAALGALLACEP